MTIGNPTLCASPSAEQFPPSNDAALSEPSQNLPQAFPNTVSEPAVRHHHDPTGRFIDLPFDKFLDRIAVTRRDAFVPKLGLLSGHEIILAEATACLLDDGTGVEFPIAADRQRQITLGVKTAAMVQAKSIGQTVDDVLAEILSREAIVGRKLGNVPNHTIMAGIVIAAVAHAGVKRRSGKPYYTHLEDTASIHREAWRALRFDTDHPHYTNIQFLDYTHDGPEDKMDPWGAYIADTVPVTPLVIKYTLWDHGVVDHHNVAVAAYNLAHVKDTDGNSKAYLDYGDDVILPRDSTGVYGKVGKACDNTQNYKHDPNFPGIEPAEIQRVYERNQRYEALMARILEHADDHGPDVAKLLETIPFVSKAAVTEESRMNYAFDIEKIAIMAKARATTNLARLTIDDIAVIKQTIAKYGL